MSAERSLPPPRALVRQLAGLIVVAAGVAGAIGLLEGPDGPSARPGPPPITVLSRRSHPIESMFQDDRLLLYSRTRTVVRTLDTLRALGVDRLRITVLWSAVAPEPASTTPPTGFDASDPAAYPATAWTPYDRVVKLARARHLRVNFDLTAPGPLWAMTPGASVTSQANHFAPSPTQFGRFVLAAGRRYSGTYVPPGRRSKLPRVGYWSVWNEPNQPGWLAPQLAGATRTPTAGAPGTPTAGAPGTPTGATTPPVLESPRLYRSYVDAAVAALAQSGHRVDTILLGDLAPEGDERLGPGLASVPPMPFLRALYCVDDSYQPLSGPAATELGCPSGAARSAFVTAHPGLFKATGFAHHPYSFFLGPAKRVRDPNFVPLSDLGRLERGLDRIFATYAVARRLPIYLTEYGYETYPPNPFRGKSPATQAAYLDQAEYMAWRDPRVRTLSQFLLVDSAPNRAYPAGTPGYWSTFQTGLDYLNGQPKPAVSFYSLPIFLPQRRFRRGATVPVWGMLRLAPNRTTQLARLQWLPAGASAAWRTLERVATSNPTGVLLVHVALPGPGAVRLVWFSPTGRPTYSRAVTVQLASG